MPIHSCAWEQILSTQAKFHLNYITSEKKISKIIYFVTTLARSCTRLPITQKTVDPIDPKYNSGRQNPARTISMSRGESVRPVYEWEGFDVRSYESAIP
jgi:hypothetical protein